MLILVIMTSSVFAMIPETMDIQTAERRSMETLLINSTNGTRYELFLISDNAHYVSDDPLYKKVYGRDALKDDYVQEGDFYVYIARLGGETAFLQKTLVRSVLWIQREHQKTGVMLSLAKMACRTF